MELICDCARKTSALAPWLNLVVMYLWSEIVHSNTP